VATDPHGGPTGLLLAPEGSNPMHQLAHGVLYEQKTII